MEPVSDLQTIRNGGYTLRRRRQNYREAAYTPRSPEKTLTYKWDDFKPWKNSLRYGCSIDMIFLSLVALKFRRTPYLLVRSKENAVLQWHVILHFSDD